MEGEDGEEELDIFNTMTTNPKWKEIEAELLPGQAAEDRPDLVARVFKQKKDQLIKDIRFGKIFGNIILIGDDSE